MFHNGLISGFSVEPCSGSRNTYRTCLDGQQVSFSNLKSFLKLYPDTHRKVIRQLVKEQSISFDDPWQVAKLIVLCQTI